MAAELVSRWSRNTGLQNRGKGFIIGERMVFITLPHTGMVRKQVGVCVVIAIVIVGTVLGTVLGCKDSENLGLLQPHPGGAALSCTSKGESLKMPHGLG